MSRKKFAFNSNKQDPDDPDSPRNGRRVEHAEKALDAFLESTGESRNVDEDAVSDLITDLMHYCDREGHPGAKLLTSAKRNWKAER